MSQSLLSGGISAPVSASPSAGADAASNPVEMATKTARWRRGTTAEKVSFSRGTRSAGSSSAFSSLSSSSTVASRKLSRGSFSAPHATIVSTEPLSSGSTCSLLGTLQREILLLAYTHGALKFGCFPMENGRTCPFTFRPDCLNSNGEALELLAKSYAYKLVQSGIGFDALFGIANKGTPLVACTSIILAREYAMHAPFVYDRKEPTEHGGGGESGQLIGAVEAFGRKTTGCVGGGAVAGGGSDSSTRPARAVLLGDVLPSLDSLRETLATLQMHFPDAEAAAVCVLFDSQDRDEHNEKLSVAQQFEVEYGTKVLAVLTTTDIVHFLNELISSGDNLEARSALQQARNNLLEYRKAYSVTDELLTDLL